MASKRPGARRFEVFDGSEGRFEIRIAPPSFLGTEYKFDEFPLLTAETFQTIGESDIADLHVGDEILL